MSELRPDCEEHEDFENQPSKRSSTNHLESVLKIFLALLLVVPAIIGLILVLIYVLGEHSITGEVISIVPILFVLAGFAVFQAYRGLVKRELILPVRRGATARYLYYGEKAEPKITGNAAVVVGVFWVLLALLFSKTAIQLLIAPLLSR